MWHCDDCNQDFQNPVAHYNQQGETCSGHPMEALALEEGGYTISKRLFDALFITLPFSLTFIIAYLATEMIYPIILIAALALPSCSSLYAVIVQKEGQYSD
jgi:hypothetical protein